MPQFVSQQDLASVLHARVNEIIDAGNSAPLVLIDGRAGSGKSTLAAELQNLIFKDGESAPRIIHMDDLYPGWNGLAEGADYLMRFILNPLKNKTKANWQEYDWQLEKRNQWREFEPGTPLIIEGCGSLSRASSPQADLSVWLEVNQEVRHARWLQREGHEFDEQWPVWAAQEVDFYAREKSSELADLIAS